MTEVRFYHLERRKPEEALPSILEEALEQKLRVVVEAPVKEWIDALDERLWTYADASFLAHSAVRDDQSDQQPIFLTTGDENPNGARLRILLGGAKAIPILAAQPTMYEKVVILFDGSDPEARSAARAQWTELKAAGYPISYWREGDTGAWESG
jgi:DNA polymerase III subunit chi